VVARILAVVPFAFSMLASGDQERVIGWVLLWVALLMFWSAGWWPWQGNWPSPYDDDEIETVDDLLKARRARIERLRQSRS
jgi:hypothetical protein